MRIRDFIVEKAAKLYGELGCKAIIEIGLGKGVMTKKFCYTSDNFFVVEMDKSLIESLKFKAPEWISQVQFVCGDVLEVNVEKVLKEKNLKPRDTLIVGNLPYYITSPIFRKFFEGGNEYPGGMFMVQDEVAQKLKFDAGKKSYLWWLINYAYDVIYLKGIPAKSFKPAPKVKSAVVQLKVKSEKLKINFQSLKQFLELYAPYSRKTLGAIQKIVEKHACKSEQVMIDEFIVPEELRGKRLEELGWKDIENILS